MLLGDAAMAANMSPVDVMQMLDDILVEADAADRYKPHPPFSIPH